MKKFVYRHLLSFAGGIVLSAAARTKPARKLAVNGMAKVLQLKDDIEYGYNKFRDEAESIYFEAKEKNKKENEYVEDFVDEE